MSHWNDWTRVAVHATDEERRRRNEQSANPQHHMEEALTPETPPTSSPASTGGSGGPSVIGAPTVRSRRWFSGVAILVAALLAACGRSPSETAPATQAPRAACLQAAHDDHGVVVASFRSTVGVIRQLPYARGDAQLADHVAREEATVCYIDGQIPKSLPPPASGTLPLSFDRAVLVVIGDQAYLVTAGYRQNLPIQAP